MSDHAQTLLVELGVEELPPKNLPNLEAAFRQGIAEGLKKEQLLASTSTATSFATPRRLAVLITAVSHCQADRHIERVGPPCKAATHPDGSPTKVGEGFARSVGVAFGDLGTKETQRGPCLYYQATQPGRPLAAVLQEILEQTLAKLPIKKRMRWGDSLDQFVRPAHWLLALHGSEVVPLHAYGLHADRQTRGHRFHCPEALSIAAAATYEEVLMTQGQVIPAFDARREATRQEILAALTAGDHADLDEALLAEVTALVEWPRAYVGSFAAGYLAVPQECLISSMKEHQKYFPILDAGGKLQPRFVVVANLESSDPSHIIRGNEKVIAPRLADAKFFYEEDRKTGLAAFRDRLKDSVFQEKLGTIFDKTERIGNLAAELAHAGQAAPEQCREAGRLCKADLASAMVYEFTELQGIMGRYYARDEQRPDEFAAAMAEHYQPRFAGDDIPASATGRMVALADKADTIVGMFGINQPPTGSKDPYSLRRQALGILRILTEAEIDLSLTEIFSKSAALYGSRLANKATVAQAVQFVMERFPAKYKEDGLPADTVAAVQALAIDAPLDFHRRVQAVAAFRELPQAESLAAANKRVKNILKDVKGHKESGAPLVGQEPAEVALAEALTTQEGHLEPLMAAGDYKGALQTLANLKAPVDRFFDEVRVMADDEAVRQQRLQLLGKLNVLLGRVADISCLQ